MNAMPKPMTHETRLDRLAEVAVRVGLGLRPGQEIVLTAPLEAVPLVRRITEHAYKAGATLVSTIFSDEQATLARFHHAPDAAFDYAPAWMFEGMAAAYRNGAARLAIGGENPAMLAGQDPTKVSRSNRARSVAYRPALELITNFATNWSIVCYATPAWAALMFPDLPEQAAVAKLWDAIFAASRIDTPDPVAAWAEHNATLRARTTPADRQAIRGAAFQRPRDRSARRPVGRPQSGWADRSRRRTASSATRTSPARRCSPPPISPASTATSAAPSRSPTPAR